MKKLDGDRLCYDRVAQRDPWRVSCHSSRAKKSGPDN